VRFTTRRSDRAANLWPLALLWFAASWRSLHQVCPAWRDGYHLDLSAAL
jgi:hypothetical protein